MGVLLKINLFSLSQEKTTRIHTKFTGPGVLPHGILLSGQQLPLLLHLDPLLLQLMQSATGHLYQEMLFSLKHSALYTTR